MCETLLIELVRDIILRRKEKREADEKDRVSWIAWSVLNNRP